MAAKKLSGCKGTTLVVPLLTKPKRAHHPSFTVPKVERMAARADTLHCLDPVSMRPIPLNSPLETSLPRLSLCGARNWQYDRGIRGKRMMVRTMSLIESDERSRRTALVAPSDSRFKLGPPCGIVDSVIRYLTFPRVTSKQDHKIP